MGDEVFIKWEERYAVGIGTIDEQHKQLVHLTNTLHQACRQGEQTAMANFKEALRAAVDYVAFHFTTEERIMEQTTYPDMAAHKKEHDGFVKKVLESTKQFDGGHTFAPKEFVEFLRDWLLTHIAVSDKKCADYILKQQRSGACNLTL
jgi:hemerythrin